MFPVFSFHIKLFYQSLFVSCRAVVDHSMGKDLPSVSIESFEYFPGRGLTATVNGIEVLHSLQK